MCCNMYVRFPQTIRAFLLVERARELFQLSHSLLEWERRRTLSFWKIGNWFFLTNFFVRLKNVLSPQQNNSIIIMAKEDNKKKKKKDEISPRKTRSKTRPAPPATFVDSAPAIPSTQRTGNFFCFFLCFFFTFEGLVCFAGIPFRLLMKYFFRL